MKKYILEIEVGIPNISEGESLPIVQIKNEKNPLQNLALILEATIFSIKNLANYKNQSIFETYEFVKSYLERGLPELENEEGEAVDPSKTGLCLGK